MTALYEQHQTRQNPPCLPAQCFTKNATFIETPGTRTHCWWGGATGLIALYQNPLFTARCESASPHFLFSYLATQHTVSKALNILPTRVKAKDMSNVVYAVVKALCT